MEEGFKNTWISFKSLNVKKRIHVATLTKLSIRGGVVMKKIAFFPFKGEKMCFMHVLINALDIHEKGGDAIIIVEGEAVKLIQVLEEEKNKMYLKVKELGLFDSICRACSAQMGVLEYNEKSGIPLKGNAMGHPAMDDYLTLGYEIITL